MTSPPTPLLLVSAFDFQKTEGEGLLKLNRRVAQNINLCYKP